VTAWCTVCKMATNPSRTPQDVQAGKRTVRMTVRVREAVSLMVWRGLKRDEAAKAIGLRDNSLYVALRKPDVRAFYLEECETLRLSGRARRLHRLEALAEQDRNVAGAVAAIKAAEQLEDDDHALGRGPRAVVPGLVIVINNNKNHAPPAIDITPGLIEQPSAVTASADTTRRIRDKSKA
jgi:hypothetical protein